MKLLAYKNLVPFVDPPCTYSSCSIPVLVALCLRLTQLSLAPKQPSTASREHKTVYFKK